VLPRGDTARHAAASIAKHLFVAASHLVRAELINASVSDKTMRNSLRKKLMRIKTISSFPDVQLHIVDAPLGAGPESILPVVVMDSGLALRAPRNDGVNFRQSA
jgi:hypothetical protein